MLVASAAMIEEKSKHPTAAKIAPALIFIDALISFSDIEAATNKAMVPSGMWLEFGVARSPVT